MLAEQELYWGGKFLFQPSSPSGTLTQAFMLQWGRVPEWNRVTGKADILAFLPFFWVHAIYQTTAWVTCHGWKSCRWIKLTLQTEWHDWACRVYLHGILYAYYLTLNCFTRFVWKITILLWALHWAGTTKLVYLGNTESKSGKYFLKISSILFTFATYFLLFLTMKCLCMCVPELLSTNAVLSEQHCAEVHTRGSSSILSARSQKHMQTQWCVVVSDL